MGHCIIITSSIPLALDDITKIIEIIIPNASREKSNKANINEDEIHKKVIEESLSILNDFLSDLDDNVGFNDLDILRYERFRNIAKLVKSASLGDVFVDYPEKGLTPIQQVVAGAFIAELAKRSNKLVIVLTSSELLTDGAVSRGARIYYVYRDRKGQVRVDDDRPGAAFALARYLGMAMIFKRRYSGK